MSTDSERLAEIGREEAPILRELADVGLSVEHIQDLYHRRLDYRQAIPILVELLPRVSHPDVKEMMVRALAVPWARGIAVPVLVDEFKGTTDDRELGYGWIVGNSLGVVADRAHFDELERLALDRSYGRSREMLVLGLGQIKGPRTVEVLTKLLDDPAVAGHAVKALARLQPPNAPELLSGFLSDERGWVRLAAKRAIDGSRRKAEAAKS